MCAMLLHPIMNGGLVVATTPLIHNSTEISVVTEESVWLDGPSNKCSKTDLRLANARSGGQPHIPEFNKTYPMLNLLRRLRPAVVPNHQSYWKMVSKQYFRISNPFRERSTKCKIFSSVIAVVIGVATGLIIWGIYKAVHKVAIGVAVILPLYIYPEPGSWDPLYSA